MGDEQEDRELCDLYRDLGHLAIKIEAMPSVHAVETITFRVELENGLVFDAVIGFLETAHGEPEVWS